VGQVDTLALMFVLGSLLFSELDRPGLAGISIGVAILLKTSPVMFLAYFILTRQYRVVLFAAITAVVLTVLSGIPFPGDVTGQFISILPKLSNEIHPTRYNLSLSSTAFRTFGDLTSYSISTLIPIADKLLMVLAVGSLSLFAWRIESKSRDRRIWLFACFQILTVVFSPLLWYHHFTFLLFPLLLFLRGPSSAIRGLGVISITLIQAERYFEAVVRAIAWPSLVAILMMLIVAYACYMYSPLAKATSYPSSPNP
jgi:alpha-1,2-mannosyltransferase